MVDAVAKYVQNLRFRATPTKKKDRLKHFANSKAEIPPVPGTLLGLLEAIDY